MTQKTKPDSQWTKRRFGRGFSAVSGLVERHVRKSGETRGFAVMKLLTQWEAIVGTETAGIATPVKVSYPRDGFGATLVLLTNGAHGPVLQAQLPRIQERVNACYGYQAISRIRITQTAPTGFHETQRAFDRKPAADPKPLSPETMAASKAMVKDIHSSDLKDALEKLSENVLRRTSIRKGEQHE